MNCLHCGNLMFCEISSLKGDENRMYRQVLMKCPSCFNQFNLSEAHKKSILENIDNE